MSRVDVRAKSKTGVIGERCQPIVKTGRTVQWSNECVVERVDGRLEGWRQTARDGSI